MTAPLMPKATAVWLVENTTLTFKQIADFCELHELEIQAIADGDVSFNILGLSPIDNNQLTIEEIKRCEADSSATLVACELERNVKLKNVKAKKCYHLLSVVKNQVLFCGLLKIVLKLLMHKYVSWLEQQSLLLRVSAMEHTVIWQILNQRIQLQSVYVLKKT